MDSNRDMMLVQRYEMSMTMHIPARSRFKEKNY